MLLTSHRSTCLFGRLLVAPCSTSFGVSLLGKAGFVSDKFGHSCPSSSALCKPPPHPSSTQKDGVGWSITKRNDEIHKSECIDRQISSSCARSTISFGIVSLTQPRTKPSQLLRSSLAISTVCFLFRWQSVTKTPKQTQSHRFETRED